MIIAGTGHRPNKLGGYNEEAFRRLTIVASNALEANKVSRVISGMALGWDQALAVAAYMNGIPFDAYVPFKGQEIKWPAASQNNYRVILAKADKIIIVSEGSYTPLKMQVRNMKMIDDCETVLAMWDGSTGGTYNCLQYAHSVQRPVINLWSEYNKWLSNPESSSL